MWDRRKNPIHTTPTGRKSKRNNKHLSRWMNLFNHLVFEDLVLVNDLDRNIHTSFHMLAIFDLCKSTFSQSFSNFILPNPCAHSCWSTHLSFLWIAPRPPPSLISFSPWSELCWPHELLHPQVQKNSNLCGHNHLHLHHRKASLYICSCPDVRALEKQNSPSNISYALWYVSLAMATGCFQRKLSNQLLRTAKDVVSDALMPHCLTKLSKQPTQFFSIYKHSSFLQAGRKLEKREIWNHWPGPPQIAALILSRSQHWRSIVQSWPSRSIALSS